MAGIGKLRLDFDWSEIKAEYLTTNASYTDLAKKYNVARSNIAAVAGREKWVELREQHKTAVFTKTLSEIEERQSSRMIKLFDMADDVLGIIQDAIADGSAQKFILSDPKKFTGAIKDIKDIYMIRSSDDMDEQRARIQKLRDTMEKPEEADDVQMVVKGWDEEWAR